ncbi:MAG: TOBE domain-containing protein [Hyphomicrobiales bacterium]|nr:TOBE domain-containing protein [Hyphomicrobiales bacterium]
MRPEALRDATEAGAIIIESSVKVVESLGRETLLYVDGAGLATVDSESQEGYIAVHRAHQSAASYGASIRLSIDPRDVFIFGPTGLTLRFPERQSTAV